MAETVMMDVDVTEENKIQLDGPLWARMAGFPFWPARRCDAIEEASMKTPKSTKVKQVCVLFLGTRCDKAWVLESSVSPFTAANLQANFLIKKFKGDKDYRAAVVEATRMIQHRGAVLEESFLDLLKTCHNVFPLVLNASECCVECGGSSMAGQLMSCHVCDVRKLHWSCCPRQDEGAWMCDDCCKLQNLPLGTLVPFETTEQPPATDAPLLPNLHFLSTLTKPNKPTSTLLQSAKLPSNKNGNTKENSLLKKVTAALKNGGESASNGLATPVSSKDPLNLHLHSTLSSPENGNVARAADLSGIDDECFVCGLGGQLVLCDFPHCTRAYHQICVARLFPDSLDSTYTDTNHNNNNNSSTSMNGSLHNSDHNSNSLTGGNDVWFCPCHTCLGCHALQCTSTKLATIDLPVRLVAQQAAAVQSGLKLNTISVTSSVNNDSGGKVAVNGPTNEHPNSVAATGTSSGGGPYYSNNRHSLRQKPLRNCSNCPFAVCGDCETVLGEGCGVLQVKRGSESLECLNCSSRDPRLKLARLLEKAWVKCANSRLALPFLRPLLPLPQSLLQTELTREKGGTHIMGAAANGVSNSTTSANGTITAVPRAPSVTSMHTACSTVSHIDTNNSNQDYWVDTIVESEVTCSATSKSHVSKYGTPSSARGKRRQNPVDVLFSNDDVSSTSSNMNVVDAVRENKRRRSNKDTVGLTCVQAETPNKPTADKLADTLKPTSSMLSESTKPTSRPADLLGVLEKIHRMGYTTVREYYSDINYIRNALQSRIDDASLPPTTATVTNKQDSIMMAYDTVIDASYHYLASKMLQVQKYEARIADSAVSETVNHSGAKGANSVNGDSSVIKDSGTSDPIGANLDPSAADKTPALCAASIDTTTNQTTTNGTTLPSTSSDTHSIAESTTTNTITTTIAASRPMRGRPRLSTNNSSNPDGSTHSSSVTIPTTAPSKSVVNTMLRLWRLETAHAVPAIVLQSILSNSHTSSTALVPSKTTIYSSNNANHTSTHDNSIHILPRSLLSWRHYIENGAFPTQFRGQNDPYSVKSQIQQEEKQFMSSNNAQYQVREMLYGCGDPEFAKYATSEMEAAQLMLGMTHSQQRESLTLFEGAPLIVAHNSKHSSYHNHTSNNSSNMYIHSIHNGDGYTDDGAGVAMDDSLLVLDRLREVAQKAVQLEERLRQQHTAQRRALLYSDTDTVTIGQASIITELKLANDNLRWRLQQKQSVVLAQQRIISDLQAQLGECKKAAK